MTTPEALRETVCTIASPDRYIAHCEIDRQFEAHSRDKRFWRYGIFRLTGQHLAVIRTGGDTPLGAHRWSPLVMPEDRSVTGIALVAPKKMKCHSPFMDDDDYARSYLTERLARHGELLKLEVAPFHFERINKPKSEFSVPARYARFTLRVKDAGAYQMLMSRGLSWGAAFGLGFVVPDTQPELFEILEAVADFENTPA